MTGTWPLLRGVALTALVSMPFSLGRAGEVQDLGAKTLEELLPKGKSGAKLGAEHGRDPSKTTLGELGSRLKDNRDHLLEAVRAFAPPDWSPYLDEVSWILDYAETLAKAEKAFDLAYATPPTSAAARVIASPQFREIAGRYYALNCRGYPIKLPPDPWPQAMLDVIALLQSPASDQEKMCRTIALVSLAAPPLMADLAEIIK